MSHSRVASAVVLARAVLTLAAKQDGVGLPQDDAQKSLAAERAAGDGRRTQPRCRRVTDAQPAGTPPVLERQFPDSESLGQRSVHSRLQTPGGSPSLDSGMHPAAQARPRTFQPGVPCRPRGHRSPRPLKDTEASYHGLLLLPQDTPFWLQNAGVLGCALNTKSVWRYPFADR